MGVEGAKPPGLNSLSSHPGGLHSCSADRQRGHGGEDGYGAGDDEGGEVLAFDLADESGAEGCGGSTELVAGGDPSEDDGGVLVAEDLVGEFEGGGHGGDPVEAVEDGEDAQAFEGEVGVGQVDEGDAADAVIDEQQFAAVVAVGEPTGGGGSDEIERSHSGEQG